MKRRWLRDLRTHGKAVVAPLVPAMADLARAFAENGHPYLAEPLVTLGDFHARAFGPLARRGAAFRRTVSDAGLLGIALAGLTRTTEPEALARLEEVARLHRGDPRLREALDRWSRAWPGSAFAQLVTRVRATWPERAFRPLDDAAQAILERGLLLVASLPQRRAVLALVNESWLHPDDAGTHAVLGDALLELELPPPPWLGPPLASPGTRPREELVLSLRGPRSQRDARFAELAAWGRSPPVRGLRRLTIDATSGPEPREVALIFELLDTPLLRDVAVVSLDVPIREIASAFGRRLVAGARLPVLDLRGYAQACLLDADAETVRLRLLDSPSRFHLSRDVAALADVTIAAGRKQLRIESSDLDVVRTMTLPVTSIPVVFAESAL